MKCSFSTLATPELSGVEAIRLARRYGYDGIDLRVSEIKGELTLDSSAAHIREIVHALEAEGIALASLFLYPHYDHLRSDARRIVEDTLKRSMALANETGARAVRLQVHGDTDPAYANVNLSSVAEMLARLLERDRSGLEIVIQNHSLYASALEVAAAVRQIGNDRVGIGYSPDHVRLGGEDADQALAAVKPAVKCLYAADLQFAQDGGYTSVLPGTGGDSFGKHYRSIRREEVRQVDHF
ncbi:sugar phosphate isomerase/epimerase family protein [Cohnella rhizosphaerae]|uniref:Sugar phosphate isomerase/epimerase n=1 Tax=Cohnella rhizosphaerae TaxID=1457232 RepID=A0A9X4KSN8_9BACL|nr:TIM barrel protein [Cohnella rhizosphaerae]MDG0810426.1 sugar phosphate isomerase/epimerase [Cohnella rhizosphaerae]